MARQWTRLFRLSTLPWIALAYGLLGMLAWIPVRLSRREEIVDVQLPRGEDQLWLGTPRQGVFLRPGDGSAIVFVLLWISAILLIGSALAPTLAVILTPFFLVIGWYMLIGRFMHDAWRRKHTVYMLTDQRAMIMRREHTHSLALGELPGLSLEQWPDGTGTISFGPTNAQRSAQHRGRRQIGWSVSPAFEHVADAGRVFHLIEDARAAIGVPSQSPNG